MRRSSGYCALLAILIAVAFWFIVAGTAAGQPPSAQLPSPAEEDRGWIDGRLPQDGTSPTSNNPKSSNNPEGKPGIDRGNPKNGNEEEQKENGKEKEEKKENGEKEEERKKLLPEGWSFHAQTTIVPDFAPGFGAQYSGPNSLGPNRDRQGTITADLYTGARRLVNASRQTRRFAADHHRWPA
jgi:hypothetical protein